MENHPDFFIIERRGMKKTIGLPSIKQNYKIDVDIAAGAILGIGNAKFSRVCLRKYCKSKAKKVTMAFDDLWYIQKLFIITGNIV